MINPCAWLQGHGGPEGPAGEKGVSVSAAYSNADDDNDNVIMLLNLFDFRELRDPQVVLGQMDYPEML